MVIVHALINSRIGVPEQDGCKSRLTCQVVGYFEFLVRTLFY